MATPNRSTSRLLFADPRRAGRLAENHNIVTKARTSRAVAERVFNNHIAAPKPAMSPTLAKLTAREIVSTLMTHGMTPGQIIEQAEAIGPNGARKVATTGDILKARAK